MRILLLSDKTPNAINWLNALNSQPGVFASIWSMRRAKLPVQFFFFVWAIIQLRIVVKRLKPELIIGYRTTSYGFLAACAGTKPIILAAQGESDVWPPGHWTNFFTSRMARFAIQRASLIHAWAKHMAESLYHHGASPQKVLVLHRGILLEKFSFLLPFSHPSEIRFICTRSLYPEYHHDLILKMLKSIEEIFSDIIFKMYIVGDGVMKDELMKLSEDLQIRSSVIWTGSVSPDKVSQWLQEADIYISLPDTEGISSSLLEAMACGCFPIVTDLPANREWILNSQCGKLVQLQIESIVAACKDVILNRHRLLDGVLQNRKIVEERADAVKNNAIFLEHYRIICQCAE